MAVQVVGIIVGHGPGRGHISLRAAHGQRVGEHIAGVAGRAPVQMLQAIIGRDIRLSQLFGQQAVVSLEVRVVQYIQAAVQPALEVSGQFLHRVLPSEEEAHVAGVQGRLHVCRVLRALLRQVDERGVALLFGDDGAALHVGSIVVEPGVDGHLAVFGRVPRCVR